MHREVPVTLGEPLQCAACTAECLHESGHQWTRNYLKDDQVAEEAFCVPRDQHHFSHLV